MYLEHSMSVSSSKKIHRLYPRSKLTSVAVINMKMSPVLFWIWSNADLPHYWFLVQLMFLLSRAEILHFHYKMYAVVNFE